MAARQIVSYDDIVPPPTDASASRHKKPKKRHSQQDVPCPPVAAAQDQSLAARLVEEDAPPVPKHIENWSANSILRAWSAAMSEFCALNPTLSSSTICKSNEAPEPLWHLAPAALKEDTEDEYYEDLEDDGQDDPMETELEPGQEEGEIPELLPSVETQLESTNMSGLDAKLVATSSESTESKMDVAQPKTNSAQCTTLSGDLPKCTEEEALANWKAAYEAAAYWQTVYEAKRTATQNEGDSTGKLH